MTNLIVLKERLKDFYGKNEVFITPTLKFLLAFAALLLINGKLGYTAKINNILIVLVVSLACSFLPVNFIAMISAVFVVVHFYSLSIECAAIALAVFLLLFVFYFRFTPKDTLVVLILPLLFMLKMPFVMPIVMGLIATPMAIISISFGTIVFYLIEHVSTNATVLNSMEAETAIMKIRFLIDGLLKNKALLVTLVVFAITVTVVYIIRRMSVDHAWTLAMIAGILCCAILSFVGDLLFDIQISVIATILGAIVSFGIAKIFQFFRFNVDYSRTENVQFEDDEYYYYVKAVPKITLSTPEKRVKKINSKKKITMHK